MKFKLGDIVYFKPTYDPDFPYVTVGLYQVIHYNIKKEAYLVVGFVPYSPTEPDHYFRTYIKEDELGLPEEINFKTDLPPNIIMFEDNLNLVRTSRLLDQYSRVRDLLEYKLVKDKYPNIHDFFAEKRKEKENELAKEKEKHK